MNITATFRSLWQRKWLSAILSGLCLVLAFPPIEIVPVAFLFPVFLNATTLGCRRPFNGFLRGFLTSLVIMAGGFYWVVYVIKVFGNMPWAVAVLLYLGFCGFGALNFPLFGAAAVWLHKRLRLAERPSRFIQLWFALALPALFTVIEFAIPKLFPWYASHAFYRWVWFTQIAEITGCTFLTFTLYSAGSVFGMWLLAPMYPNFKPRPATAAIPVALVVLCVGFSAARLGSDLNGPSGKRRFDVALVQANIGSLEKAAARRGVIDRIRFVVDRYKALTESTLVSGETDLIVWPETAMPFYLTGSGLYDGDIRNVVKRWNTPLITGAYYPYRQGHHRDYNAAYLLDPVTEDKTVRQEVYYKNILLAFGEYFPLGDAFPDLYRWFPQVSSFKRGSEQEPLTLHDGTRIGVTICYEAIVPSFFRKVARKSVNLVVNLTNDSWFGPTSEPYQHAALSVFRAIESRVPFFRVTNTGISFSVDVLGRMSDRTPVYEEGALHTTQWIPVEPPTTIYLRFGDWFVAVCIILLLSLVFSDHVAVPLRSLRRGPAS